MKSFKFLILLFVLGSKWLFVHNGNLDPKDSLVREKRTKCGTQDKVSFLLEKVAAAFEIASNLDKVTTFLEAIKSISQIRGKIFDFNSANYCDLSNQLDTIVDKLENLETVVKCMWHMHYYRQTLSKLEHLIGIYKQIRQDKSKISKLNSVCQSQSEGISKIYSEIKTLFKQDELLDNIENCCHYKTNLYTNLFGKLISLSTLFLTALKFCEEAQNQKIDFNTTLFSQDLENFVHYFTKQAILEKFVTDKGHYGLEASVKRLANKSVSLSSFQQDYDFFRWKVVYVVNHSPTCYTEEAWKLKCSPRYVCWTRSDSIFCGSKRETCQIDSNTIHALIAWCHKDKTEINSTINILDNYSNENEKSAILNFVLSQTNQMDKKIHFAITVLKGGWFFNWMNPVESHGGMNFKRSSKWFHGTYDTFWSEWYAKQKLSKPKFNQSAVVLA